MPTGRYSVYHSFRESAEQHSDRIAVSTIGDSEKNGISYRRLLQQVDAFAHRLLQDGLHPGDRVALFMKNSPAWVIADLAIARCGGISVPIHSTYTYDYVEHILQHSGSSFLCVDAALKKSMQSQLNTYKTLKIYESESIVQDATAAHPDSSVAYEPQSNDVHTIVYTSGTTGKPKGVELTHVNILSNVRALVQHIAVFPSDTFFSFLPLSHILERTAGYYVPLLSGAQITYARSIETLAEDMQFAKPTIVVSVPRIFERVHEKIIKKLSSNAIVHLLFIRAHRAAVRRLEGRLSFVDALMYYIGEKLIFHNVRGAFGGMLRFAVSGGGALPKHIAEFFESLGVLILEGYGLTETSPVLAANQIEMHKFGTVGLPLASAEIRIAPNGEILAKGDSVMKGYHDAPELTAEVIDSDGWFHTGDLGSIDADGFLLIIGRIKEMIVLSTGRNVFPVPIEQALEESPLILQAMVYGDTERAIAALIVPELDNLRMLCEKEQITYEMPQVLSNQRVHVVYAEEIKKMLEHFQSFEQVREFKLVAEKWTMENDMLTLSQKLKRRNIIEKSQ